MTELAIAKPPGTDVKWWKPQSLPEAMEFAKLIAQSDMIPTDFRGKPANVILAIQAGAEVGVGPFQALQGIAVINGRPSIWGDLMLAVCRAHPDFEDIEETVEGEGLDRKGVCVVKRRGQSPVRREFSMHDAKRAGLMGKKGPWSQYPDRMLQMRPRGFALRDSFTDALKGIPQAEEMIDLQATQVTVSDTPEPVSRVEAVKAKVLPAAEEPPETEEPAPERFIEDDHRAMVLSLVNQKIWQRGNGEPEAMAKIQQDIEAKVGQKLDDVPTAGLEKMLEAMEGSDG